MFRLRTFPALQQGGSEFASPDEFVQAKGWRIMLSAFVLAAELFGWTGRAAIAEGIRSLYAIDVPSDDVIDHTAELVEFLLTLGPKERAELLALDQSPVPPEELAVPADEPRPYVHGF